MKTPSSQPTRIFLSPPHLSGAELDLVKDAFASNYIAPLGPMVDAFEKEFSEYTGIPHCVAVSSGTAAMHLALRHILQKDQDNCENDSSQYKKPLILASTLTFIGSVSPIIYENAEPVFIDCEPASWNMDPDLLEKTLDEYASEKIRPAAVVPTDLYGQCCNLPRIRRISKRYQTPVICDSAEAMGAHYLENIPQNKSKTATDTRTHTAATDPVGTNSSPHNEWQHAGWGAYGSVYSFNGNKMITSSGGGMLASHDSELIVHARKLATQAREPAPHYEHSEIGFNYRMSNIVAAIGLGQLRILDTRIKQARTVFQGYNERLRDIPGIELMPEPAVNRSNRWLTVILIDSAKFGADKEEIRIALENENIESRPVWKPMHMQPVFANNRIIGGPVSEKLFHTGLCLPSGTALTDADLDRICDIIRHVGTP